MISRETTTPTLTPRWTQLRYHAVQAALWASQARFTVVPAGRRSGKTEIVGKRKLVLRALLAHRKDTPFYRPYHDTYFAVAAPTREQAKRIYLNDILKLIPPKFIKGRVNRSQLIIPLVNGAEIHLLGMDKPERAEGSPWDHIVLDEYGNMKSDAWGEHIRPALSDRLGGCEFIGVPEGRNHYYELWKEAQSYQSASEKPKSDWETYHWFSEDILPPEEIEAARSELDELTFEQEYRGSFVSFTGRAYYNFDEKTHCATLQYNHRAPLIFAFDFNISPGVAAVLQEQKLPNGEDGTGVIGEVWIPRNSNTPMVCRRLIKDWGDHAGRIFCYGDATGGAGGTAKVKGSDWEIIRQTLGAHFGHDKVFYKVPRANPRERDRVNAVNSRLKSSDGGIRLMVDPARAPNVIKDFEGVTVVEGGSGELDKKSQPMLSHISDGLSYMINREYPTKFKPYSRTGRKHWK